MTLLLLALAASVTAHGGIGFSRAKGQTVNLHQLAHRAIPTGAIACDIGESKCHNSCMPAESVCCKAQDGAFCDIGYTCYDQGCCPEGQKCDGPPSGCDGKFKLCKSYCIPLDAVCCNSEAIEGPAYCAKGEQCLPAGRCSSSNGGGDKPVSSQGERSTKSPPTGTMTKVLSDVYSLETMTASSSASSPESSDDTQPTDAEASAAQTTATDADATGSQSNAEATEKPTETQAGKNAADGLHAPAIVAGALAFAALLV